MLEAVKGVNWRSFGECLPLYINFDKVTEGCVSYEACLEAVVKEYLTQYNKPSWRDVIWSLYMTNQFHLADPRIRSYAEPLEGVLFCCSLKCMIRKCVKLSAGVTTKICAQLTDIHM